MHPVLLSTSDGKGGAAIATHRLHQGLRQIGVDSRMLVQTRTTEDHTVTTAIRKRNGIASMARRSLDGWPLRFYPGSKQLFSPAIVPDDLAKKVSLLGADLVHLFWINSGYLRIESLKKFQCPVVWTLHDMWPLTGGCHYDDFCGRFSASCGSCPVLGSVDEHDLSRRIFLRKQKAWSAVPIVLVATSVWLAKMARSSSLFSDSRIEVIPNGVDTNVYKPIDKQVARRCYGLPEDKRLLLFSAFGATHDKRKGYQFLVPALRELAAGGLSESVELVVIGSSARPEDPDLGMKVHYIPRLRDEISQVLLYSAADLLVAPSMQENLSNTVMESLSCGTPVVAFDIGGMPDMIEHQRNGYLARPFEIDDLARGIRWGIDHADHCALSESARRSVLERFTIGAISERYLDLYRSVLGKT